MQFLGTFVHPSGAVLRIHGPEGTDFGRLVSNFRGLAALGPEFRVEVVGSGSEIADTRERYKGQQDKGQGKPA